MGRAGSLAEVDLDALKRGEPSTPHEAALLPVVNVLRAEQWQHAAPVMSASLRAQIAAPAAVAPSRLARGWKLVLAGAAGLIVGGATLGVAGAQGALPDPLQDATSRAATIVGIDLPTAAEADDERRDDGDDQTPGASDPQGPPTTTKSGTRPADPGTPGDHEPATPADPGNGEPNRGENRTEGNANGTDNGAENGNPDPGSGTQGNAGSNGRVPPTPGTTGNAGANGGGRPG